MSDPGTSDAQRCPRCGADFVPATSPLGACPACLLELGASDPAGTPAPVPEAVLTVPPVPITSPSTARRVGHRPRLVWIIAAAALAAIFLIAMFRLPGDATFPLTTIVRFGLNLPDDTESLDGAQFAVSPDGTRIVLAARSADGQQRLWVRPLQSMEWHELARTEGAALPFWSPDSRDIGFFAEKKLKRIDLSNGLTLTLCDATAGRGGTWSRLGVIVFAPSGAGPLQRVPASGGTPQPATALDQARGAAAHSWPHFLPDGRRFLFVESAAGRTSGAPAGGLYVGSLDSAAKKLIVAGGGAGAFAQGFLLFARGTALMAQRFDPNRAELAADVQQISEAERMGALSTGGATFSVSEGGVLVHGTGDPHQSQLMWFDRSGRVVGTIGEPVDYQHFSLSPDGRRVAVARRDGQDASSSIWLIDLDRRVTSRLTIGPSQDSSPLWSPDGRRIVYVSRRDGIEDLYAVDASGGGKEQVVHQSAESKQPTDWSPDGRFLLYSTESASTGSDLWMLPIGADRPSTSSGRPEPVEGRKPQPLLQTPAIESDGRFSPDGRWVAYVSDESGKDEVYVRTFPQADGRWQISAGGGSRPRWRRDGRELFFVSPAGQLLAVDVQSGPTPGIGAPRTLFPMRQADDYDISADGQRFLVKMPVGERSRDTLRVVVNWTAELRQSAGR